MQTPRYLAALCLAMSLVLQALSAHAEPLQFRWPLPAFAKVTQATIDDLGNFAVQFDLKATRTPGGDTIQVTASNYRLLYLNRLLFEGSKLDNFDIFAVLHRLSIPEFTADGRGRLLQSTPPDPQEIETAFIQNVSSARAASLREWFVERRPADFGRVREHSASYWQAQIPYWEYWIGKWHSIFGPNPQDLDRKQPLPLAGLTVPGETHLIERLPSPDCRHCVAVAAEDRFTQDDLAPYDSQLAAQIGMTRAPGTPPMTGLRAYVRTEAIIDWQTMLPYRVQAMTIIFQDLADGSTENFDQTKHFYFEWQQETAQRETQ